MCANYNENLEKYKVLYTAYADEIRNLWQRSIFLGTFMVLVWTGYGALQLKAIEKYPQNPYIYHCVSIGLCLVIITLSLLWIAMAKGSKFVQETHEEYIKTFIKDKLDLKILYCDLDNDDNDNIVKQIDSDDNLVFSGVLSAFRYSPSRINIILGWISFVISSALALFYFITLLLSFFTPHCCVIIGGIIVIGIVAIAILCSFCCMKDYLKGGK